LIGELPGACFATFAGGFAAGGKYTQLWLVRYPKAGWRKRPIDWHLAKKRQPETHAIQISSKNAGSILPVSAVI
jgi:hypothetical protein